MCYLDPFSKNNLKKDIIANGRKRIPCFISLSRKTSFDDKAVRISSN